MNSQSHGISLVTGLIHIIGHLQRGKKGQESLSAIQFLCVIGRIICAVQDVGALQKFSLLNVI